MSTKTIAKGFKYRIYPTAEQAQKIDRILWQNGVFYNELLSLSEYIYRCSKDFDNTPVDEYKDSLLGLESHEEILDKGLYDALSYSTMSLVIQTCKGKSGELILQDFGKSYVGFTKRNVEFAYKNFFNRCKKNVSGKKGHPKYKSRKNPNRSVSYQFPTRLKKAHQLFNKSSYGYVSVPKVGLVKMVYHREIPEEAVGSISKVTISKNPSGQYFASFSVNEFEYEQAAPSDEIVGIDLGVRDLCITSDGKKYKNPKPYIRAQRRLNRLQRRFAHMEPGSNRHKRQRQRIAKLYQHCSEQRKHLIHDLTNDLVENYGTICMETLRVDNMVKNHRLAKHITDGSMGAISQTLEYKADWNDRHIERIPTFYPSSKTCSVCGYKNDNLKSKARWVCPECGTHHDRDINAAKNILNLGLEQIQEKENPAN